MYAYQIMCVVVDQESGNIDVICYYYISEKKFDLENFPNERPDIINKVMDEIDKMVEDTEREYVISQLPEKLFNEFSAPGLFSPEGELLYDFSN